MSDILADEIIARHRDEVPFADIAKPVQDIRHPQRDRRLAGSGIAGEAHMQRWRVVRQAKGLAGAFDDKQRGDVADALLDRFQANQLAVEIVQHFGDAGTFILLRQIDSLRGFVRLLHGLDHVTQSVDPSHTPA